MLDSMEGDCTVFACTGFQFKFTAGGYLGGFGVEEAPLHDSVSDGHSG